MEPGGRLTTRNVVNKLRQFLSLVKHSRLDIYKVEGIFHDKPLRILVADDTHTLHYIRNLAFPADSKISKLGRTSALSAHTLADADADIVIVAANLLLSNNYRQRDFHLVPKWVHLILRLTAHPDDLINNLQIDDRHNIKKTLNKATKSGFSYRLTNDIGWLDMFYYDMYKPYLSQRYGHLSILHPYSHAKMLFLKGKGLELMLDDESVGGAVLYEQNGIAYTPCLGMMRDREDLVKAGAHSIIYYYTMLEAFSWGCRIIDFGHSRPFLSDGVTRFKTKWGMEVADDDDGIAVFAIATPGNTEQAKEFLTSNPYFVISTNGVHLLRPTTD